MACRRVLSHRGQPLSGRRGTVLLAVLDASATAIDVIFVAAQRATRENNRPVSRMRHLMRAPWREEKDRLPADVVPGLAQVLQTVRLGASVMIVTATTMYTGAAPHPSFRTRAHTRTLQDDFGGDATRDDATTAHPEGVHDR